MLQSQENFIDVTSIEPKLKHPTIFNVFDGLSGGQSLTIHNDHDPKPVYYQLLGERGDIFNWKYLQQGPEWWDVLITKRGVEETETVGQVAVKDIRKAEVFKKYGIDFCCGGKKTIRQACAEKGLDATRIEQELQEVTKLVQPGRNSFNEWEIDFLCDYIVNVHHNYVRRYLPELQAYSTKVAQVHGSRHAELLEVKDLVLLIKQELEAHLEEEEQVLFEYVKAISTANKHNLPLTNQHQNLPVLIDALEQDHDLVGRAFEKIKALTNNYQLPQDACASYSLLYKLLQEFEEDLHMHIHLENNLLFPKAIDMEKLINSRNN